MHVVAIVCVYNRLSRGNRVALFVTIRDIWLRGFGPIFDTSTFVSLAGHTLNMRRPICLIAAAMAIAAPVVLWSAQAGSRATVGLSARHGGATEPPSCSTSWLGVVLKQYW